MLLEGPNYTGDIDTVDVQHYFLYHIMNTMYQIFYLQISH